MFKRYLYMEGSTAIIGSGGENLIDNSGIVSCSDGQVIIHTYNDDGHQVVHCSGWDGKRDYRVIDLVAIQFKSLCIPEDDYRKVIAFVIDGNPDNTHAFNIGYRFKDGKLEYRPLSGFYYVPGMTSIVINEDGVILNSKTGVIITQRITKPNIKNNDKGGYRRIACRFQKEKQTSMLRHRALCLVFKEYPNNVDSITVNHRNGIPGDDWLSNLEWSTYSENLFHAHKTGLIKRSTPVQIRDFATGKVTEYYSISECARVLGQRKATIFSRLNQSRFGKVFQGGIQIKKTSDQRPWVSSNNPEHETQINQNAIAIEARNLLTNEKRFFNSINKAGQFIGQEYIRDYFSAGKQPLFLPGWQFKRVGETWNEIKNVEETLYKLHREVMAKNVDTGDIIIASSSGQMGVLLSLVGDNIRKAALSRGNKVYRGYRFRLGISTEPWPETKIRQYEGGVF